MSETEAAPPGPDFTKGIAARDVAEDSMLVGHVGGAGRAAGSRRWQAQCYQRNLYALSGRAVTAEESDEP